jgi:hypothetical protein
MPAKNYAQTVPAVSTAGNDQSTEVAVCEYNGTVTAVSYTPDATITGAATNNRTFNLVDKGQTGVGATVVATLNFGNGTNAPAADEKAITLSGTAANLVVASGDVLEWQSVHVGTGITDPGGLVRITIDRTYS